MLEVKVIFRPASRRGEEQVASVTIVNDGSASDGSGDSPFGNYNVIASWRYKDGRTRSAEARVEGFERRKSALALLQQALDALGEATRT